MAFFLQDLHFCQHMMDIPVHLHNCIFCFLSNFIRIMENIFILSYNIPVSSSGSSICIDSASSSVTLAIIPEEDILKEQKVFMKYKE